MGALAGLGRTDRLAILAARTAKNKRRKAWKQKAEKIRTFHAGRR